MPNGVPFCSNGLLGTLRTELQLSPSCGSTTAVLVGLCRLTFKVGNVSRRKPMVLCTANDKRMVPVVRKHCTINVCSSGTIRYYGSVGIGKPDRELNAVIALACAFSLVERS